MDLVLYRKYRPKTFSGIEGQEHVVRTLQGALKLGKIAHAYLFTGPRGTGKTTIARLLARTLNCEKNSRPEAGSQKLEAVSTEPCNRCSICQEINDGRSMDLIEIDAASNRGIDEIRNLKETVRFSPARNKYKIFIIDEVHMLTKEASNALLKTLEEPPEHAIFILATTEPHKMLPTIISRVQRFDFKKLTNDQIIAKLKKISQKEKISIDDDSLGLIARGSEGSLRDAESGLAKLIAFCGPKINVDLVKETLGFIPLNFSIQLLDFIGRKQASEAVNLVNQIYNSGLDLEQFTDNLIDYLRKILIAKTSPAVVVGFSDELNQDGIKIVSDFAASLESSFIINAINIFVEAKNQIRISPIPQLPLELAIVKLTSG